MKKSQNVRTRALVGAALVTVAITIPFLPTMVNNVQDATTAALVLTKQKLQQNALKKYAPISPSAIPLKQPTLVAPKTNYTVTPGNSIKKVTPVSNTLFFTTPSSQGTSTRTNPPASSSQAAKYITLPTIPQFIQYILGPSSRNSAGSVSTSSRPMSPSSSSRTSTYTSVPPTTSSSRYSTYTSTVPTTSSSRTSSSSYSYSYPTSTTTSSSSRTSSSYSYSTVATTSSSSRWSSFSSSLHNAANSSSSSMCNAMRSTSGLCCDSGDSNRNGMIDEIEPECNTQTTTSSSVGNLTCSTNPMGDSDGDGIVNGADPDCV